MKTRLLLLAACLVSLAALSERPAAAGEPYVEFLKALKAKGYGEQALTYLDQIAARPDLPGDLKRDLVLERSKALRIAANEAYDAEQRTNRLAESKKLSEQFFKDNPDHPEAASTLLDEAKDSLLRGQMGLAQMRGAKDAADQKQARAAARTALTEARKLFTESEKTLKARLDAMPPPDKPARGRTSQRDNVELSWLEARFCGAQACLFSAQTY